MNATEQAPHRTVTQALDHRLGDVEIIIGQLMTNDNALIARDQVKEQHFAELDVTLRQFGAQLDQLHAWRARPFWARLRWLVVGS